MPRATRSKILVVVGIGLAVGGWCIPDLRTGAPRFDFYERLRAVLYICSAVTLLFAWWLRPQKPIESPEEQLRARVRFWLPLPITIYAMVSFPLVIAGAGRYGGGTMVVVAVFELGLILNVIHRFRLKRQLQRRLNGLCQQCGYCLNGNVSGICPECGRRIPIRR